jgi:hypothetical protein
VSGLHKPGEFGRWNQGDVARASPSDNHRFLLIYHLVEHTGEILAETGIRRFARHEILNFIVQDSCTFLASPVPRSTTIPTPGRASPSPPEKNFQELSNSPFPNRLRVKQAYPIRLTANR